MTVPGIKAINIFGEAGRPTPKNMRLLEAVDLGLRRLAVRDPSEKICSTGLALMTV